MRPGMFGDNQEQNVGTGAVAVQAGNDVHITQNGLNMADVKELTQIFLDRHLPALRAEAEATARKHAGEFLDEFVKKLAVANTVKPEAFARPDSQACFSSALLSSAEKGDQIDLAMLASMVVARLEQDSAPLLKLVYEEAIAALPRITKEQIAFLTFILFTKHITPKHPSVHILELNAQRVMPLIEPGFLLSTANREYLCSKGLLNINLVADANLMLSNYKRGVPDFPQTDEELIETYPALNKIIEAYGADSLPTCFLTASGKLIALSALEVAFGKLDMSIWIN